MLQGQVYSISYGQNRLMPVTLAAAFITYDAMIIIEDEQIKMQEKVWSKSQATQKCFQPIASMV